MKRWRFIITKEAELNLERLDSLTRKRVLKKLKWLVDNFGQITPLPLGSQWRGFLKLRVGNWRVIYEIEISKSLIIVHYINHRDKIYKKR